MNTYCYSNVIWLESGYKMSSLVCKTTLLKMQLDTDKYSLIQHKRVHPNVLVVRAF